jgi:hypothetical protein
MILQTEKEGFMTTKAKDEGDLFLADWNDASQVNTVERWTELWDKWFICRFSELRKQVEIEGGFGDNEDEAPCVYATHDEMVNCELGGGGSVTPRGSLENVIASYFELEDGNEAEAAIRAAVERGIAKGRERFA